MRALTLSTSVMVMDSVARLHVYYIHISLNLCSVYDYRLRGNAVLTATGFVNEKCQFSTPTESTPLHRSPKKLSQVITSATPTALLN